MLLPSICGEWERFWTGKSRLHAQTQGGTEGTPVSPPYACNQAGGGATHQKRCWEGCISLGAVPGGNAKDARFLGPCGWRKGGAPAPSTASSRGPELPGVSSPHTPPTQVTTSNLSFLGAPGVQRRCSISCIFPGKKIKPKKRNDASRVIQPAMPGLGLEKTCPVYRGPLPTLFKLTLEAEAWKGTGGGVRRGRMG